MPSNCGGHRFAAPLRFYRPRNGLDRSGIFRDVCRELLIP